MNVILRTLIAMAASTLLGTAAQAQTARDVVGPSPLVAIKNEPAPRLVVDPPLSEPLSRGLVFIQYRTENIRVVPVFGKGALDVSPRIDHVHITVDDAPWHFVDAAGQTIIVVGLPPGPHRCSSSLPIRRTACSPVGASASMCRPAPARPDDPAQPPRHEGAPPSERF